MSSDTREQPKDGTIEEVPLSEVNTGITVYVAEDDKAAVIEIEHRETYPVRVYLNGSPIFR